MLSGGGLAEGMVGMADRFGGWWDRQADRWSWQRKRVWISERGLADCPDLVSQMWIRLQDNSRIGSGANALLMKTCFICFVYIQSVTLYEKLDFYDCGFAAFPSAAVELRFWRAFDAAPLAGVIFIFYRRLIGLSWDSNWPQTDTMTGRVVLFFHQALVKY